MILSKNKVNNNFFESPSKKIILFSDTHWGGKENDGMAVDDIEETIKCIKNFDPDYILHLGDVADFGTDEEFYKAYENFSEIINSTKINKIWCIGGGAHDGLVGYVPIEEYYNFGLLIKKIISVIKKTNIGEKLYEIISLLTQDNRYRFYTGFYKILNQTSQFYTLKIGNNVFVMLGYFHQPACWSSGEYGGYSEANILNKNKLNWLDKTLAKWNNTGNNIFICHHFPLYHTNIYTHSWAGMKHDRFIYESKIIKNILVNYSDVVAWFSGHVHVGSNATYSSHPEVSKGTAVSGASRDDLPDNIHFINCGNIWKEHGKAWDLKKNSFSNFRYFDMIENQNYIDIKAWDSTNKRSATITVNNTKNEVLSYRIDLPYQIRDINNAIEYEQGWDVYDYCELKYQWYKDSEGLRRDCDGWIESRWDFWEEKDFSRASLNVNTSDPSALNHQIYYSKDGMKTWSKNYYSLINFTAMPHSRWIKIVTKIKTNQEIYIKNIFFDFC